jgi:hypothetical protein
MRAHCGGSKLAAMTTRNLRTPALAALCAAGLLAVPAAASAAGSTVVAGPLKVKDYTMTLTATDGSSDSLGVMFSRTAGKSSQLHSYSFSQGVTVKATGKSASIKGSLGRYGKIDLNLRGVGAAKRGVVPKGCTGTTGKSRAGTFRGSFKLVADSTYFKTVSAQSLKGQILRGGSLKCDGAAGGPEAKAPTTLSATLQQPAGMLMFTALKAADGAVTQHAMRMDTAAATAPASIMHMISAPGGAAAFAPSADLSSATGTAVSPFFTGGFSFASDMAMGASAMGKLGGDLVAAFDSIGAQPIAAGAPDAMIVSG